MTKDCEHEIGRKAIGGFPGHEQIHSVGEQLCLKCGKTLKELLSIPQIPLDEIAGGLKSDLTIDSGGEPQNEYGEGYNQALSDLVKAIKECGGSEERSPKASRETSLGAGADEK